jgi:hypothetical protein
MRIVWAYRVIEIPQGVIAHGTQLTVVDDICMVWSEYILGAFPFRAICKCADEFPRGRSQNRELQVFFS